MNSAHNDNEIKALKDKIANLEQENTALTNFLIKIEKHSPFLSYSPKEKVPIEKRILACEALIRKLFLESPDAIIVWEQSGKIAAANEAACLIFDLPSEELHNQQIKFPLTKANKKTGRVTCNIRDKKHFEYWTDRAILDGYNFTIFRDVTEKVEMEDRLSKSDSLNMIGELAAGIAHEIRNPMTALKGFIQLLESSTEGAYSLYFKVITSELQRIDSIINEFLILSKPQESNYAYMDLVNIMKETVDFITAQAVLHDVEFRTHYEADIPKINCEPNQLKKVFINIMKNAIEAMPNGGLVNIMINRDEIGRLCISIKDEGEGIPEDKLLILGEPFYTTKEKGTGLGLMVSYKIIEEHGGTIGVESEVGKGTCFHLYLPVN